MVGNRPCRRAVRSLLHEEAECLKPVFLRKRGKGGNGLATVHDSIFVEMSNQCQLFSLSPRCIYTVSSNRPNFIPTFSIRPAWRNPSLR